MSRLGTDAGQVEDLVARLRGLIRDYPLGVGVFKELIQNADDAGASWVRFTLDLRTLDAIALPDPRMGSLVGPALMAASDQVFRDQDIEAIQRLQEGHKYADAAATGRFGLGFNAVYNVTDHPSFATKGVIITFDPHRDAVAEETGRPGRRWTLAELWQSAPGWPKAFGLRPDQAHTEETVFRLPLRVRGGRDRLGEQRVDPAVMQELVREVAGGGGALLLFLRNVVKLELAIIDPGGGRWSATISTTNLKVVQDHRARLSAGLRGVTVQDAWKRWRKDPGSLPEELYEHRISIAVKGGKRREERWLVAQGASLESQERLLEAADELLRIAEKPLPIVGAACLLPASSAEGLPLIDGRLYCTLPLPDPIGLPFHVNAFVDLDSSRRGPTASDDLAGDALLRKRWNEALLQKLLPVAAARLLGEVARRASSGELALSVPYALCPRLSGRRPRWAEAMARSILTAFQDVPFVPHQGSTQIRMYSVPSARLVPRGWSGGLRAALAADDFDLAEPLPEDLLRSFREVGARFAEVSPASLRQWLQGVAGDEWPSFAAAPRACLRQCFNEVLRLCGEGRKALLVGLPLGLRQDGVLVRLGTVGQVVFFGWPVFESLFPTCSRWFWGKALEEEVDPAQVQGRRMNADLVAFNLKTYLSGEATSWQSVAPHPPNAIWLQRVLEYLAREDLSEAGVGALGKLSLLPGGDDRLHLAGPASKVVSGVPERIQLATEALGWVKGGGSKSLQAAVQALATRHPRVAPSCTADLVSQAMIKVGPEGLKRLTPEQLSSVVEYLAREWARETIFPDPAPLKSLPLWTTIAGTRVAASQGSVFLASQFQPPPGLLALQIVGELPTDVRVLAKKLGLKELNAEGFACELVHVLGDMGREGEAARSWLVDQPWQNWSEDTQRSLSNFLRVFDSNNQPRVASELFDPRQEGALTLMEGLLHTPAEPSRSDRWLWLLQRLGMRTELCGEDLQRLLRHGASQPTTSRERCDRLLSWLEEQFKDQRHFASKEESLTDLAAAVSTTSWISCAQRRPLMTEEFRGESLQAPRSCFTYRWLDLVGNVAPVLPRLVRVDLADALGCPKRPPSELVQKQFQQTTQSPGGQEALECYALSLLGWLQDEKEPPAFVKQEAWIPWMGRRYTPARAFFEDVAWSDGLFGQAPPKLASKFRSKLEGAGVVQRPGIAALADLLRSLQRQSLTERIPDSKRHLNVSAHAYRCLQVLWEEAKVPHSPSNWPGRKETGAWPVPTRSGHFHPMAKAVVDDAPWLKDVLKDAEVHWLHEGVQQAFALELGARRASTAIRKDFAQGCPSQKVPERLNQLQQRLGDPAFRSALLRLLAHALVGRGEDAIKEARCRIAPLRWTIKLYDSLEVRWSLDSRELARDADELFVKVTNHTVEIGLACPERDWSRTLARCVVEALGYSELFNNAALEELLAAPPGDDLNRLLDLRRIPTDPGTMVAALPSVGGGVGGISGSGSTDPGEFDPDGNGGDEDIPPHAPPGPTHRSTNRTVNVKEPTRTHPAQHQPAVLGPPVVRVPPTQPPASPPGKQGTRMPPGRDSFASDEDEPLVWVDGHWRSYPGSGRTSYHRAGIRQLTERFLADLRGLVEGPVPRVKANAPNQTPSAKETKLGALRVVRRGRSREETGAVNRAAERARSEGWRTGPLQNPTSSCLPDLCLSRGSETRNIFVCILSGYWDDQVVELRVSALRDLLKLETKGWLYIVESAGRPSERTYEIKAPFCEEWTLRLGKESQAEINATRARKK